MRLHGPVPLALPAPYDTPLRADGAIPHLPTRSLVATQVDALLAQTAEFSKLSRNTQRHIRDRLVHIGSYAAELVRENYLLSASLNQRPVQKTRLTMSPAAEPDTVARSRSMTSPTPPASATAQSDGNSDGFQTQSANQVARVTRETLRAISFPTFVADLLRGSFQAIVNSTIEQLEAFGELLANVSKGVDAFMADNITDNQAKDWLATRYPGLMRVDNSGGQPALVAVERDDADELPNFREELNLADAVDSLDSETINEILVPAARRRLAENRLQILSTMVMMGLQRIVVKHGRIRATMGFHIDASDRMQRAEATDFDFNTSLNASASFLAWSANLSTSVSYVRSTRMESDSELNVESDLTGEVDLTFESDYLPLNRFASAVQIERIRANTPVPENNTPSANAVQQPVAASG